MQHDFNDGLKLAEEHYRTKNEYLQLIGNPQFIMKYPQLFQKITQKVEQYKEKFRNANNKAEWEKQLKLYVHSTQKLRTNPTTQDSIDTQQIPSTPSAKALYQQIDELYAPLLRTKQLQKENMSDTRTRGERIGEEYLYTVQHLGHYVKDKLISYIYIINFYPLRQTTKKSLLMRSKKRS
ncbi:MAG: hypothetical protein LBU27_02310 [Candidatus Peribacteria bacterium]|jgi:hypothetical protein|nr:hypothetical protein [Candidatus Peribacteria bacterium]